MGWDREQDGFWTDRSDAGQELQSRIDGQVISAALVEPLRQFIETGVACLPGVLSDAQVDAVREAMETANQSPSRFYIRSRRKLKHPTPERTEGHKFRFMDLHVNSPSAMEAILCDGITNFLNVVFGEIPVLFQNLAFVSGSQQRIHQDSAYVVVSEPLKFAGVWIALEDIQPGSGELEYYPGSHQWPHYLFGNRQYKSWLPKRDGMAANGKYLDWLDYQAREHGVKAEPFLAKKGDALIWAADLAHGGSKIGDPDLSRFSLVGHFCPESITPSYCNVSHYGRVAYRGGMFSSRYYDLNSPGDEGYYPGVLAEEPDD